MLRQIWMGDGCLLAKEKTDQSSRCSVCESNHEMRRAAGSVHAESGGVIFLAVVLFQSFMCFQELFALTDNLNPKLSALKQTEQMDRATTSYLKYTL